MSEDPIFSPNRETRREIAGRPCCACNEAMAAADIIGVRTDDAVLWMHGACVRSLLANADTDATDEA